MNKLTITYNDATHRYEIALQNAIGSCEEFIKEREMVDVKIDNKIDYDKLYDNRTEINNKLKEIKNSRIQACKSVVGDFERDCKELEKMLLDAGQRMTERLEQYKPRKKSETKYVLTIATTDKKAYEKVKNYALKYLCEIKE